MEGGSHVTMLGCIPCKLCDEIIVLTKLIMAAHTELAGLTHIQCPTVLTSRRRCSSQSQKSKAAHLVAFSKVFHTKGSQCYWEVWAVSMWSVLGWRTLHHKRDWKKALHCEPHTGKETQISDWIIYLVVKTDESKASQGSRWHAGLDTQWLWATVTVL